MVDRFDVTWILAIGFFLWSAATTVTGLVHGFAALLVMRFVIGIAESVAYPVYGNIIALHIPEHHRGIANSLIQAGQASGPAFVTFAGGMAISRFGWRPFFIILGLTSLLWLVPWFRWRPRGHSISQEKSRPLTGILQVMKRKSAWGTCIGMFSANYVLYLLLTWLPFYLVKERHFSLVSTAQIAGAVFLLKAISAIASGRLSDVWISSGATPTLVRKTFMCVGLTLSGIFLVLLGLASKDHSVILLLGASASVGLYSPQWGATVQTLAGPTLTGTWMGLQGCVGNLAGVVAPAITGIVVDRTGHFLWAFVITAVVGWLGVASWWFLVGPVQQVAWND